MSEYSDVDVTVTHWPKHLTGESWAVYISNPNTYGEHLTGESWAVYISNPNTYGVCIAVWDRPEDAEAHAKVLREAIAWGDET